MDIETARGLLFDFLCLSFERRLRLNMNGRWSEVKIKNTATEMAADQVSMLTDSQIQARVIQLQHDLRRPLDPPNGGRRGGNGDPEKPPGTYW